MPFSTRCYWPTYRPSGGKFPFMRARLLRDSAWILGIVCALEAIFLLPRQRFGVDAHAYWLAWRGPMYTTAPGTPDAYLYSPAFAHALWPFAQLPWPVFVALFTVLIAIVLGWLLKPLGWKCALPLWLAGLPEIVSGNVFILMALVAVIGFARPESWAFVALTKITPCLGPVWFLARGEWRQLLQSALSIGVIAAVSAAIAPGLWQEWFRFLATHISEAGGPIGSPFVPPSIVRIPLGIALVIWGARKNKPWTIPVAMLLCAPVFWLGSFTLLAAIPRITAAQRLQSSAIASPV